MDWVNWSVVWMISCNRAVEDSAEESKGWIALEERAYCDLSCWTTERIVGGVEALGSEGTLDVLMAANRAVI